MRKAAVISKQTIRRYHPSSPSYETLLESLAEPSTSISRLHQIHALVITNGFSSKSVLACRLINSYASLCGLVDAHKLFDFLRRRTSHIYNYMLKAYTDRNQYQSVFGLYLNLLFDKEVSPDAVTFSLVVKACINLRLLREGKIVHAHVLVSGCQSDLRLATDLLHLYSKCGCIEFAWMQFRLVPQRDIFVWTAMIDGLLRDGSHTEALNLFHEMREKGLKANVIAWNALVSGFARNGLVSNVLELIILMQVDGTRPDDVTLSTILPLFAHIAILKPGFEAHAYAVRNGLDSSLFVVSSLVDMYAKCGKLVLARCIFDMAETKDTGLWNAIIVGYGMHGDCREAFFLFEKMTYSGIRPNEITFTSVLSACSHGGLVSEGRRIFGMMVGDYGIIPHQEHYACVVDMNGRAGFLEEAYDFIKSMPIEPTKDIWGAFLSACRIHSDVKFMEIGAKHMMSSNKVGEDAGYHVMMSNIYAESGQWVDMAKLRARIREGGLKKRTGCSWIEVGDAVHTFSMADMSHPQSGEIYHLLRNLNVVISSVFSNKKQGS